jgi:hypothetical protein
VRRRKRPETLLPYFFCERAYAGALTPWHIRPVGDKGRCPGGGADTVALCGREVSWDVSCEVTAESLQRVEPCRRCAAALR